MKNTIKIRVPKVDINNWSAHEMKIDPFWVDLLVEHKKQRKCKLTR
jgi:hypothetical protein